MWSTEHAVTTTARRQAVWALLSDTAAWPEWNPEIASISLDGPLATGAQARLKRRKGPKVKVRFEDVRPNERYTAVSRLPGARLRLDHEVADHSDGARICLRASISGPLARLWERLLGRQLRRDMRHDAHTLARVAATARPSAL